MANGRETRMDGLWYMHVFRAHRTSTIFPIEGGLDGLSLRVSNEGLQRPRVARAQKINSLHPLFL